MIITLLPHTQNSNPTSNSSMSLKNKDHLFQYNVFTHTSIIDYQRNESEAEYEMFSPQRMSVTPHKIDTVPNSASKENRLYK